MRVTILPKVIILFIPSMIAKGFFTTRLYKLCSFFVIIKGIVHTIDFFCITVQGRIQFRLRGGGEFQLVELIYILGESNLSRKGCN